MDINNVKIISKLARKEEMFWKNPAYNTNNDLPFSMADIKEAEARLERFSSYLKAVFPETKKNHGKIESELIELNKFKEDIFPHLTGRLLLKGDHALPISGSIKARGGIYEVLKFAEKVALEHTDFTIDSDYKILNTKQYKELFSNYTIAVGSTGNLGLSIGIMSAKFGFNVTVHMSQDAKQWKKELLREKGVNVVEHVEDYGVAVTKGRQEASKDPFTHFVDDEASSDLFLGYAVSALRLQKQLEHKNIVVDEFHPLYVYLPCGVGGGPGGVAFGLKEVFGEHVHPIFVEPVEAPCMTLGMITKLHDEISVQDIGLSGKTIADGLAVGRPSKLVGHIMTSLLFASSTVHDEKLYEYLKQLKDIEDIFIEPSATSGFHALKQIAETEINTENATHIVWSTGGEMVPLKEQKVYYEAARKK